jgi:hypothetical protein
MDFSLRSNQIAVLITAVAGVSGLLLTIVGDGPDWLAVSAGGVVFLTWALTRELDPDRDSTALIAAVLAGAWTLSGFLTALVPILGALSVARVLVETTGRRPLLSDLAPLVVFGAAMAFNPLGFVIGFAVAVAIYVDDRMAAEPNPWALMLAIVGAAGATALAALSGKFSGGLGPFEPAFVAALTALALVTALRPPPTPTSQVDSRRKTFIREDRLHTGRTAVALAVAFGALIAGDQAEALVPVAIALVLSLASSEIERTQRARL